MRFGRAMTVTIAAGVLTSTAALTGPAALADDERRRFGQAIDTEADLTPFEKFQPLASSAPCPGEPAGRQAKPFVLPAGFQQQVLAQEGDPGTNVTPTTGT